MLSTSALQQELNAALVSGLLLFPAVNLEVLLMPGWLGSTVSDPSNEAATDTGQPVQHEGQLIEPFAKIILRCKYSLSSTESDSELFMGRMPPNRFESNGSN